MGWESQVKLARQTRNFGGWEVQGMPPGVTPQREAKMSIGPDYSIYYLVGSSTASRENC